MYTKNIKNHVYVCPTCLGKLEECKCQNLPFTLIQIDKHMLPIIQELNRKFYRTTGCCEGHINSFDEIYVEFSKNYKIKTPLPKGFKKIYGGVCAQITGRTEQAKKRKKRELLNSLYKWACELEPNGINPWIV